MASTRFHFASQMNFLDPLLNEDGTPYGPTQYRNLVRERVAIAKNTNTSYIDVGKITPLERKYIMQFLHEENQRKQEMLEQAKMANK